MNRKTCFSVKVLVVFLFGVFASSVLPVQADDFPVDPYPKPPDQQDPWPGWEIGGGGGTGGCLGDGYQDCSDEAGRDIAHCQVLCRFFACLGFPTCMTIAQDNYRTCRLQVELDCAI